MIQKVEQEHKEEISQLKADMLRKDNKVNALNENIVSLNSELLHCLTFLPSSPPPSLPTRVGTDPQGW